MGIGETDSGYSEKKYVRVFVDVDIFNEKISPYLNSIADGEPKIVNQSITFKLPEGKVFTDPCGSEIEIIALSSCLPEVKNKLEELATEKPQEDQGYRTEFVGSEKTPEAQRKYIKRTMKR